MMRRKLFIFLLIFGGCFAAFPQDTANRLLNLLDEVISAATESGRVTPVPSPSNQERPSFSLYNNTSFTVKSVYICPSGSDDWGVNILSTLLYDGLSIVVTLDVPLSGAGVYNIRMVDVDGDYYTKYEVKIGESSVVKMTISDFEFDR
ncbi:MAG: hypothetical protein LBD48_05065 [Treponema sp.]|jgi:hypothetical protein|nr:hypothetical protein [Treponema sp.]